MLPCLGGGLAVMFGVIGASSVPHAVLSIALALNEMALAVWLLVKGFRPVMGVSPQ